MEHWNRSMSPPIATIDDVHVRHHTPQFASTIHLKNNTRIYHHLRNQKKLNHKTNQQCNLATIDAKERAHDRQTQSALIFYDNNENSQIPIRKNKKQEDTNYLLFRWYFLLRFLSLSLSLSLSSFLCRFRRGSTSSSSSLSPLSSSCFFDLRRRLDDFDLRASLSTSTSTSSSSLSSLPWRRRRRWRGCSVTLDDDDVISIFSLSLSSSESRCLWRCFVDNFDD